MDILNLPEHIRILEELLLHQDFSSSPDALEAMLGDEFREINPAGNIVSRAEVIAWLLEKNPADRWEFNEFEVRQLAEDLVLATYHARKILPENSTSDGAMHCSIWQETGPGKTWKLMFHQSTRVKQREQ